MHRDPIDLSHREEINVTTQLHDPCEPDASLKVQVLLRMIESCELSRSSSSCSACESRLIPRGTLLTLLLRTSLREWQGSAERARLRLSVSFASVTRLLIVCMNAS